MEGRRPETGRSLQGDRLRSLESAAGGPAMEDTVVSQERMAAKLEMKSAAHVSQHSRHLDGTSAITKMPKEQKPFLEEADATNS